MQQIYRRTPMPNCDFNKVAFKASHTLKIDVFELLGNKDIGKLLSIYESLFQD